MAEHSGKDILSSDVEIKGSIKFQKELLIDGKVEGEIHSDGVLTIGENAPPHCRHMVLLAATYSICLKPQCGHSTLTLAGPGLATGRGGEGGCG